MKKIKRNIIIAAAVIILLGLYYYIALPAVNIHSTEFWVFLAIRISIAPGRGAVCEKEEPQPV